MSYHVYGVGHAILDMEFRQVHNEVLTALSIEKGMMTLIDHDRHQELLMQLGSMSHVVACGGSVANSIAMLALLGAKTYLSCRVADDTAGAHYHNNLSEAGIDSNLSDQKPAGITGRLIALITPDADRSMNTFLGIASDICPDDIDVKALQKSEYVYVEGYLVTGDSNYAAGTRAIDLARQHGVKVSVTLSDPGIATHFREKFLSWLAEPIDLLFCNEQEALLFTDTKTLAEAVPVLQKYAKQMVITCGANGALLYDQGQEYKVDSTPVDAVDTLGAGDTFAGTFLFAITHGFSAVEAAKLASYVAAKVVAKFGPRLEPDDVIDVKQDIQYAIEARDIIETA